MAQVSPLSVAAKPHKGTTYEVPGFRLRQRAELTSSKASTPIFNHVFVPTQPHAGFTQLAFLL